MNRRLLGLAALALVPVLVLVAFFVVPVAAMLQLGFWPDGELDVAGVLRMLKAVGFTGPIGVQGYGIGGDRRENLARSIGAWRKLSTEAAR